MGLPAIRTLDLGSLVGKERGCLPLALRTNLRLTRRGFQLDGDPQLDPTEAGLNERVLRVQRDRAANRRGREPMRPIPEITGRLRARVLISARRRSRPCGGP